MRNTHDDAVQTQPPEVVGHPANGVVGWVLSQQLRQQRAYFLIGETPRLKTEQHQHTEQRLHAHIPEPQGRSPLPIHFLERVFPQRTIVRNSLDVQ